MRNHFLKIFVISILLIFGFWGMGYYLAPSKTTFIRDHSWLYQLIWFPVHIVLAYFSVLVYKKAAFGIRHQDLSLNVLLRDLKQNYRAIMVALLLIAPFMVQDFLEGMTELTRDFDTLGNATWVKIGPVWMIEWLMLGVMWSRVLATIRLTIKSYTPNYVREHLDDLLIIHPTSPLLQAGVENALINLFYAISTIGYIQFAGGELSDYQNVGISALLVLVCFLVSFLYMRKRITEALEAIVAAHAHKLQTAYGSSDPQSLSNVFLKQKLNADLLNQFVFDNAAGLSKRSYERMAIVRAGLLIDSIQLSGSAETLQVDQGLAAVKYTQYELKLASLGIEELQGVIIRLGSPVVMYLIKSSDIVSKLTS